MKKITIQIVDEAEYEKIALIAGVKDLTVEEYALDGLRFRLECDFNSELSTLWGAGEECAPKEKEAVEA